jgi:uncharacterized protein YecE (DUF72 family)
MKVGEMLRYYAERFSSVEVNNTFYRMPKPSVVEAWATEVPENFRFVIKASQRITHLERLKASAESVAYLLQVTAALGHRLGPILFQLPPNLKVDVARLERFLALCPKDRQITFEFRHDSWFADEVLALLRAHGAALCLAEAENGFETPFIATADWGYLRLRSPDYADGDLRAWRDRVAAMPWREAYVFFKHEDEGKGPALARRFLAAR